MSVQQSDTQTGLLDAIANLCNEARAIEVLEEEHIASIEEFLYGNVVQNLIRTLLNEKNKQELKEQFEIDESELSKIISNPNLVAFTTDVDPKGTAKDYIQFKNTLSTAVSPKLVEFANYFESMILLKDCEEQIKRLRKHRSKKFQDFIQVGFTNGSDTFTNIGDAKFDYFNKYSDEELEEIYNSSPFNRESIDKVREFRRKQKGT